MAYDSMMEPGELIITDTTNWDQFHRIDRGRGLELHHMTAQRYAGIAEPFPAELLIPDSEWEARVKEMEETKTRLSDLIRRSGLPPKDQAQTNYCWINAPTHSVEVVRYLQNQKTVILSPASAGAPVVKFQNEGGLGTWALKQLQDAGCCPVDNWPANAIDRKYYTEENKQIALQYRVGRWIECNPRNLKQVMSLLLRRIPVPVGLNWWSHEILFCDVVWKDGAPAIRFRNSWGVNWPQQGAGGWSILQGNRMIPDDAVAPWWVNAA